jgi:hypothetical protein
MQISPSCILGPGRGTCVGSVITLEFFPFFDRLDIISASFVVDVIYNPPAFADPHGHRRNAYSSAELPVLADHA